MPRQRIDLVTNWRWTDIASSNREIAAPSRFEKQDDNRIKCLVCNCSLLNEKTFKEHCNSRKHKVAEELFLCSVEDAADQIQSLVIDNDRFFELDEYDILSEPPPELRVPPEPEQNEEIRATEEPNMYNYEKYYGVNTPVVNTTTRKECNPRFKNPKTQEFVQGLNRTHATYETKKFVMEFIEKHYEDKELPHSNYFFDAASDHFFPGFDVYKQVINEEEVFFHKIDDICKKVFDTHDTFNNFEWDPKDSYEKSRASHFNIWRTLHIPGKKILFVKIFVDEYQITDRKVTKSHALYMSFANFCPKEQKSVETKWMLCILPPIKYFKKDTRKEKSKREFYTYMYNVVVKQILNMKGKDFTGTNGETYMVQLYSFLGDHPGQALLIGVKGAYNSTMPNVRCKGGNLPKSAPCEPRTFEETFGLINEHAEFLEQRIRNTVGAAQDALDKYSINFPPSPMFLILEENYFYRFGICRMHLIYEGMAALLLKSFANE